MPMYSIRLEELRRRCAHIDVDDSGFVVKKVSTATIKPSWRPALDAVRNMCLERCGDRLDSVYVLGSAARGVATDGISDLDMIAITTTKVPAGRPGWTADIGERIVHDFPFVSRMELLARTRADIGVQEGLRWLIKLHTVCIYGHDRSEDIPSYRFGPDITAYRRTIQKDLRASAARMQIETDHHAIASHCEWIAKRILRAGFELVMERVGTLTSDSDACCEFFSVYYPEKAALMRCVLELANRPTNQRPLVIAVVAGFIDWLPAEVSRIFGESSTTDSDNVMFPEDPSVHRLSLQ